MEQQVTGAQINRMMQEYFKQTLSGGLLGLLWAIWPPHFFSSASQELMCDYIADKINKGELPNTADFDAAKWPSPRSVERGE